MADNGPESENNDSGGGNIPAAEQNQVAADPTENERESHRWAILTGKGVIAYTIFTAIIMIAAICSAWDSRRSLTLTREIFVADQRPIIWLTDHTDTPHLTQGGQIVWNLESANYGKSPAVRITYETYISLDGGPFTRSYGQDETKIGAPHPPGKVDFDSVISSPGISSAEFTRLMALDQAISISGSIRYEDANRGHYEMAFCLGPLASGATLYRKPSDNCHNDIR